MIKGTEYDDTPIFYCSRCMSLNIVKGKQIGNTDAHILTCADCGAGPKHIDITNIHKYTSVFIERTGHHPLANDPNPYDDWKNVYDEETEEIITETEALTNGMKVRDVINLKID